MDACGADTQGALGYALQQNFQNEFKRFGIKANAVTVVTQMEVDADDPAFKKPTKPIGSFMEEAKARERAEKDGWSIAEDAGRGWRRVVPSPRPLRIVEEEAIRDLLEKNFVVICAGGGGIPVRADGDGILEGVAAVIDKDLAAALLATRIGADLFVISTAVEQVALNYGKPDQRWLDRLSLAEAKRLLAEGTHFAAGSMAPKVQAVIEYLERGGKKALITSPEALERAMAGKTGTWIEP
jgi:carbamate kinase